MSKWLIYNNTGVFTGVSINCPAEHLDQNVPEGCGCIMGTFDTLSQRVDMETGLVVNYQPPSPSPDHQWNADTWRWEYIAPLPNAKAAAIDAIDSVSDAARTAILVKSTNTVEYQIALADAIKYRDAGFAGPAPRGVSGWSHAKRRQGWTDQRAAEDILAAEARWMAALYFIRDTRLDAKEMVRDAATNAEVDTLLATFIATLTANMQDVQ